VVYAYDGMDIYEGINPNLCCARFIFAEGSADGIQLPGSVGRFADRGKPMNDCVFIKSGTHR